MPRWIALVALLALTFAAGCGDDSDPNGPGDGNSLWDGTINANLAGEHTLNFRCTAGYGLQADDVEEGGLMQVQGSVTQGSDVYMISIQVYHAPATGTYDLAFASQTGVGTVSKNNVGSFAESGTVTFTQVSSSRMKGTFSFTAFRMAAVGDQRTTTVTQGTFDVPVIFED